MPTLTIKDVPEGWAETLRQRAARNHRSLQGELMALVERAVIESDSAPKGSAQLEHVSSRAPVQVVDPDHFGHSVMRRGSKTIEEIGAEHRKRFPKPISGSALAVDIIRADRDAR